MGGDVNRYSPVENSVEISYKTKTELPYDPAILTLGIYLKKMNTLIQEDTYIPMFIVALFTISYKNNLSDVH